VSHLHGAFSRSIAAELLLFRVTLDPASVVKKGGTAMKPARLPLRKRADGRHRLRIIALAPALLAGCEQNTHVPPPPLPRTILPVSAISLPNK